MTDFFSKGIVVVTSVLFLFGCHGDRWWVVCFCFSSVGRCLGSLAHWWRTLKKIPVVIDILYLTLSSAVPKSPPSLHPFSPPSVSRSLSLSHSFLLSDRQLQQQQQQAELEGGGGCEASYEAGQITLPQVRHP